MVQSRRMKGVKEDRTNFLERQDKNQGDNVHECVVTKFPKMSKVTKSDPMFAVDCEMVLCQDGTEAVVKVCLVDSNLEVKLNELVKPNKPISDYRTEITGICAEDLEGVTCSLSDVQKSMKRVLSHGAILIGHNLSNDLQALKLDHALVIDTRFIYNNVLGGITCKRPSLNDLCKVVLGSEVRKEGAPHNCLDDARAAMKLVLAKLDEGFGDGIDIVGKDVPETERAKLFIHKIPYLTPVKELQGIFPKDFTFVLQFKKVQKPHWSAIAVFKDQHEANEAFESLEGKIEKDSFGKLQKIVSFTLSTRVTNSLPVPNMGLDGGLGLEETATSKKRSAQVDSLQESKKQKIDTDSCKNHAKEIEGLKVEVTRLRPAQVDSSCENHTKEIEGLKPEVTKLKPAQVGSLQESKKQKIDTDSCKNHAKEIGGSKLEVIRLKPAQVGSLQESKKQKIVTDSCENHAKEIEGLKPEVTKLKPAQVGSLQESKEQKIVTDSCENHAKEIEGLKPEVTKLKPAQVGSLQESKKQKIVTDSGENHAKEIEGLKLEVTKLKPAQVGSLQESKKQKIVTDSCENHVKEIEGLKPEVPRLKPAQVDSLQESKKQKIDTDSCKNHAKEIEGLKPEVTKLKPAQVDSLQESKKQKIDTDSCKNHAKEIGGSKLEVTRLKPAQVGGLQESKKQKIVIDSCENHAKEIEGLKPEVTKLKPAQVGNLQESKKQKIDTDSCKNHAKEIGGLKLEVTRLKQELQRRDEELLSLQKIVTALIRK